MSQTSNQLDALVYANIRNNLTPSQMTNTGLSTTIVPPNPSKTGDYLDGILSETVIKRACCNNLNRSNVNSSSFAVPVRIPMPVDYIPGDNSLASVWKKFGYIDKTVYVPASMCGEYAPGHDYTTQKCQDFMALYCNNAKAFYKDELASLGASYNDAEWAQYKPECSCYGDQPNYLTGSIPHSCYAPGCGSDNPQAFLDIASRQPCSVTICQSNLNFAGMTVGEIANIDSKITQTCGNQINQAKTAAIGDQTPGQNGNNMFNNDNSGSNGNSGGSGTSGSGTSSVTGGSGTGSGTSGSGTSGSGSSARNTGSGIGTSTGTSTGTGSSSARNTGASVPTSTTDGSASIPKTTPKTTPEDAKAVTPTGESDSSMSTTTIIIIVVVIVVVLLCCSSSAFLLFRKK